MGRINKIPTLLGLVLVVIIVATVGFVFDRVFRFETSASPSTVPTGVSITNVSDTAFTISWITEATATGAVSLEAAGEKRRIIFDERDAEYPREPKKLTQSSTHSVSVRSLTPTTTYALKILSNGRPYLSAGKPYSVQTAPSLSGPGTGLDPAYGTVFDVTGQAAADALVYLQPSTGQKLSTLTKSGGTWLIPLNLARTEDLSSFLSLVTDRLEETILVRTGREEAHVTTDTLNDSPVPAITLGKTYDFRGQQALRKNPEQTTQNLASSPPSVLGTQTTDTPSSRGVRITKPANGEALITNLPLIQGTGIPGKTVSVVIGITQPVSGTTTVGGDGIWRHTPARFLAPGKQSVTITTVNSHNKPVAITHTFEVLKSGTQVLGEATPSATLTPTLTPSPTATPTPTPTDLLSQPVPESGWDLPTMLMVLMGIGVFVSGIFFLAL